MLWERKVILPNQTTCSACFVQTRMARCKSESGNGLVSSVFIMGTDMPAICSCFIHECAVLSVLQVIRILKELKQKYPDKELDQLVELANYYALLHQQKSRAFYRIQVTCTHTYFSRRAPEANIQGRPDTQIGHKLVQGLFSLFWLLFFLQAKHKKDVAYKHKLTTLLDTPCKYVISQSSQAFRHIDMVKMSFWSSNLASEWAQKGI